MSDDQQVQEAVSAIVRDLLPLPEGETPTPERILSLFWPYVRHALSDLPGPKPPAVKGDQRTKSWQYTVRFWLQSDTGSELLAETDPAVMPSTGKVPGILSDLAIQMHGEDTPIDLSPQELKGRLQQLRNNLGRYGSASLKVPYCVKEERYLAQMDVLRLATST